jgi:nucleotidyltransferase/DNA polymerase involved in DNA repair
MFATIYVPNFFLQAAMRHQQLSSIPVALIDEQEKKPPIIQLNHAAESAGVRHGMTPSQGLARCLNLVIKPRSSIQEESLTNLLLQYCFSLTPLVEATAPGVWTVQFTRVDNLFEKVTSIVRRLGALEIAAQAGIAPTPDMSFLAANLAQPVLEISRPEKFLAPLPIDILAVPFQH